MAPGFNECLVVVRVVQVEAATVNCGLDISTYGGVQRERRFKLALNFFLEAYRDSSGRRHSLSVLVSILDALTAYSQAEGHESAQ